MVRLQGRGGECCGVGRLDQCHHRPPNNGICLLCSGMPFMPQVLCSALETGKHLVMEVCWALVQGHRCPAGHCLDAQSGAGLRGAL